MARGHLPRRFRRDGEVSNLEWLLLEFQRVEGCEDTKAKLINIMKHQVGNVFRFTHRALVRPDHVKRARELLDAGNPTPVVRDALTTAFGCSTRHAYNLISEALDQRGQDRAAAMRRAQMDMFRPHP